MVWQALRRDWLGLGLGMVRLGAIGFGSERRALRHGIKELILMSKLVVHPTYGLYERKDGVFCSSVQVAQEFGKSHKNVLADIRNIDCSEDFNRLNFQLVKYTDEKGEKRPMYLLSKNGFLFLAMSYRGTRAALIKESYIKRFDEMEAFIRDFIATRDENQSFTLAIMEAHDEPKSYHYSNEYDLINRLVLGVSAKEFKVQHGLDGIHSIRPLLSKEQQKAIKTLQAFDIGLLYKGVEYAERKKTLSTLFREKFPALSSGFARAAMLE